VFKLKLQQKIEAPRAIFGAKLLVLQEILPNEQVRSLVPEPGLADNFSFAARLSV
jgi:hypothetical protein